MIQLSDEQHRAILSQPDQPLRLVDAATQEAYVLLRADEYDRLKSVAYDLSPWTADEMDLLASEDADGLGWVGMEVYQDQKS